MKPRTFTHYLFIGCLFCLCFLSLAETSVRSQSFIHEKESVERIDYVPLHVFGSSSGLIYDTADVGVVSTTSYPGHFAKVEVCLRNQVSIVAFDFLITLSNPDLINFHTDSIGIDSITIPVDTRTGPPPHGDSCYVDSIVYFPVRYCYIDTVGSLIGGFPFVRCTGELGDTSSPDCKWIRVIAVAPYDNPIPADTGYRTLFKFGVDALCISDTTSERSVTFYMFPGVNSFLSDPDGNLVPHRYHPGDLTVWWGVPGDVNNDSLVDIGDIVYLINFLYKEGSEPCVREAADVNDDLLVDVGDVVHLINYLFKGGPPPSG